MRKPRWSGYLASQGIMANTLTGMLARHSQAPCAGTSLEEDGGGGPRPPTPMHWGQLQTGRAKRAGTLYPSGNCLAGGAHGRANRHEPQVPKAPPETRGAQEMLRPEACHSQNCLSTQEQAASPTGSPSKVHGSTKWPDGAVATAHRPDAARAILVPRSQLPALPPLRGMHWCQAAQGA
uniref:Uncharacterized protein n=1 Tax=Sphaerodactylus townsendi TaxID=933632 RepID=A0ACB8EQV9_9SAUR